jgi:hypothetical protein
MTIKSDGGIFGRNPTFNDVTVGGTVTNINNATYFVVGGTYQTV